MRLQDICLPLLLVGAVLIQNTESRRIRVRPQEDEEDYYEGEPQEEEQRVVYISSADQYNGLYGQPSSTPRTTHDNYIQRQSPTRAPISTKTKEKAPPVQTIRNYNKVNDDGSFTFGYEAADGSFKEETRGTDCVVRGKYGYVDPDGNKREFTYVSGNPCDPNAPKEEEPEEKPEESNESDNFPANYPTRPIRPIQRPLPQAPKPVTVFQNTYHQDEDEQPEPEQVLKQQPVQPVRLSRPEYIRPQYIDVEQDIYRPRLVPVVAQSTPAPVVYKQTETPLTITPRPFTVPGSSRGKQPATTYRPQLVQYSVTPRPSVLYTKSQLRPTYPSSTSYPSSTPTTRGNLDFDAEFQKFQTEHNAVSPTPKTLSKSTTTKYAKPTSTIPVAQPTPSPGGQVYSSELVYDPSTGQYKTQLYQSLPQTEGDFSLSQRIQPYVHQPQQQQVINIKQLQQQSPLYRQLGARPPVASPSQALYQQQQAELQFHNSAQLYAQQQRTRQQQQQQQQQQAATPQPIYYIQPALAHQGGQIEAFLRGHNIQF